MPPQIRALCALLALAQFAAGCATYSEHMAGARGDVDQGNYSKAISRYNKLLDVDSGEEEPSRIKGITPLLLLERGMLLQAESNFSHSRRDWNLADESVELLDYTTDVAGEIGRYIYSDSAGAFRITPVERVALNSFNMLNYLAMGDLAGARVEAQRFTVMRDYLRDFDATNTDGAFGSYLAGYVFEKLGQSEAALRYYDEALAGNHLKSLIEPVALLARKSGYRGQRIQQFLDDTGAPSPGDLAEDEGEILVIVSSGRVPYKIPRRMPIGAALGFAGSFITGNPKILERSLFKVIVYPDLVGSSAPSTGVRGGVEDEPLSFDLVSDLGKDIRREYEEMKPRIIGAAVSRLIARALVAEGARAAGQQAGSVGGTVGLLAALVTEGVLVAADKPDTRSWTFLPDHIYVARRRVKAGKYEISLVPAKTRHWGRKVLVDVQPGGYAVVVATILH